MSPCHICIKVIQLTHLSFCLIYQQVEYYGECPTPLIEFYGDVVGFYINCATESDVFGKGMASGAYFFHPSDDGTEWILNGYPSMIFDDQVLAPKKSTVETFLFDDIIPLMETNDWRFSFMADGKLGTMLSGFDAVVFGHGYHFTHEAGLDYLKRRTSINTDEKIFALRKSFLVRLRDTFGIGLDPDSFDEIPLDGVIDLGGGNKIMAYVVNEAADQRVVTKRGHSGPKVAMMPIGSRLHEGGFRFVVGRAGIVTNEGRIPFGSVWQEGNLKLNPPLVAVPYQCHQFVLHPTLNPPFSLCISLSLFRKVSISWKTLQRKISRSPFTPSALPF